MTQIEQAFQLPYKINERIRPGQGLKIAEKVFLNLESPFEWPSMDQEDGSSRGFCYGLKSHVAILVDGTVVPCCLDGDGAIKLGNIHVTPFSEIIQGERAKKITRGFQKKECFEPLCRKCTYRKRFD